MQPLRRFPPALYADALESWTFLDLADKRPLFTSPFGDVFLQTESGFWFLDVIAGDLTRLWSSEGQRMNWPALAARSRTGPGKMPRTTVAANPTAITIVVRMLGIITTGPSPTGSEKNISTITRA